MLLEYYLLERWLFFSYAYYVFHVRHAAVAYFNVAFIEHIVKFVVSSKCLLINFKNWFPTFVETFCCMGDWTRLFFLYFLLFLYLFISFYILIFLYFLIFLNFWSIFSRRRTHCVKSARIWSFFWSVFSHIRTEYGETLHTLYLSTFSPNAGKYRLEKFRIPTLSCSDINLRFCPYTGKYGLWRNITPAYFTQWSWL